MDLGRPGVVWLDGGAVPVRLTGAGRAVARLVEEAAPPGARMPGSRPLAVAPQSGQAGGGRVRFGRSRADGPVSEAQLAFGVGTGPASVAQAGATSRTLQVGGRRRRDAAGAIDRWYRREARERIEAVTGAEAARLELEPGKITIRDQKTRWGSCSTSGTLSFNWRLAIGPGHALRYVVIHELIHIRHHNHSRAFWDALTEAMPDWKRSAGWLRANERLLTAYRPRF
jgi:hypothetical protein